MIKDTGIHGEYRLREKTNVLGAFLVGGRTGMSVQMKYCLCILAILLYVHIVTIHMPSCVVYTQP